MRPYQASLGTRVIAVLCAALLIPANVVSAPFSQPQAATHNGDISGQIPNDQLDSLVAPIALYPDPLLAQVLAASTYPLEIIQLQQWMTRHPDLKGEALASAVEKEDWDPAVQGLAALPDVVKRLGDDIKWTNDLGNAFLAQQKDVMDAVQRMRKKASDAGNLKTTEQQKVTTQVVETKEVIVIQQANPQVVYVPVYSPVVVYGPPIYPYPPIYYPPLGYYAAGVAIGFGVGIAMGAFWGRRLGLRPALGLRQREHQRQQPVCESLQPLYPQQHQPGRRQLESQPGASRRRAVRGSQDGEPVWRHGAGRFDGDATGDGPAESGRVGAAQPRRRQAERDHRCESGVAGSNSPGTSNGATRHGARAPATALAIAAFRARVPPAEAATPSAARRAAGPAAALREAAAARLVQRGRVTGRRRRGRR